MKHFFTLSGLLLLLGLFACQGEKTSAAAGTPKAFTAKDAEKRKESQSAPQTLGPAPIQADGYKAIGWEDLAKVSFTEKYYEEVKGYLLFPEFTKDVKALENQKVGIKGYVIPLSPGRYVLSANPFASCFFCGNAGPESVLELYLQDTTAVYFSDDFVRFGGVLELNDSDIDHLNYILRDALPLKD